MSQSGCRYTLREDGIYHFVFDDLQRLTIDEYFRHLERLYPLFPPGTRARLVVDTRPAHGLIPMLGYIVEKSRDIERRAPYRPPVALAMVMKMNIFGRVLDKTLRIFVRSYDQLRFFDVNEFDRAIQWLNSVEATNRD